ncbi:sensor histidine kinase [archaeon]|nr:sensor histidine kinase [archaeon]
MKIYLPNSVWIGNIDQFIRSFDASDENILEITSHEKWVSVHPVVLCMISALGLFMREKKAEIKFKKMQAKSKHYFERMGVFEFLQLVSEIKITKHESAGRFIPVQKITNSKELDEFIKEMIPLLHVKSEQAEPIKYIVSELVRNVFEHANTTNGAFVCAQYYKKSNTIRIGVVDTGIGIKNTLTMHHHPKDDKEAILLALTPGITGTTKKVGGTEFNAGAGLFFIKSLAKIKRNFFMIYSGAGMYKLLKTPKNRQTKIFTDPLKDHISCNYNFPIWHGTVVAIDLCLDEDIDFNRLLDLIREAYREGRKSQSTRYKKPRFI